MFEKIMENQHEILLRIKGLEKEIKSKKATEKPEDIKVPNGLKVYLTTCNPIEIEI